MKKVKKALLAVGAVTVVTGITVALKKLYDDYRHFIDFEVDDIALEDAPKLYAESRLNSLKEKINNTGNDGSSEDKNEDDEDDFVSEDEFWDDDEEDFCESEDDSVGFYDDEDEDDDYSFADVEEEPREKTDFEKVCGVTREEAIKVILSHNKTHSKELLDVLEDASLAEIYSSLK